MFFACISEKNRVVSLYTALKYAKYLLNFISSLAKFSVSALRTVFKDTYVSQSKRILKMHCPIIEVVTSILLSVCMRSG